MFLGKMRSGERVTVELSVQILRTALSDVDRVPADRAPVRLALRCLWRHCPERWPLYSFWEGCQGDRAAGRQQTMTSAFNGILRQLHRSGAWPDATGS